GRGSTRPASCAVLMNAARPPTRPWPKQRVSPMSETIARELRSVLGPDHVLSSPADLVTYGYDATYVSHLPDVVVFPNSTEQVRQVLAVARAHHVPVFTRGSGTGLSGGS